MAQAQASEINITEVLRQVAHEKEIDMDQWIAALEDAVASAAKKQHRIKEPVRSRLDRETGKFQAFIVKQVVEEVEDPAAEWTLEEAQAEKPDAVIGEEILMPLSTEGLGRIAAQSAKQVLYQRVREAEREKIWNEYHERVGEVINGTVRRFERGDIIVDMGTEAIVPRREQSRHERYSQGERIPRRRGRRAQAAQGTTDRAVTHRPSPAGQAVRDGSAGDLRRHRDHQAGRAGTGRTRQGRCALKRT